MHKYYLLIIIYLCLPAPSTCFAAKPAIEIAPTVVTSITKPLSTAKAHFIKLNKSGTPLANQNADYQKQAWACVIDTESKLTWEVKARQGTFNKNSHTFSWYFADNKSNGGFRGTRDKGHCANSPCNTQAFTRKLSTNNYCGSKRWRLPTREELRSLVDYSKQTQGPVIDTRYFPNAIAQFYWSSSPDASSSDSAWGIGFTFGYDYSYFKSDAAHIRLVHD